MILESVRISAQGGRCHNKRNINHHLGLLQSGVLQSGNSYNQGSYNQGFLQSGVLIVRVSYNLGSYIPGFLQSGVSQSGVLIIRGSYNQGFLRSGVLTIRGLTMRFTSVYLTWHICAQLLILIVAPYIQGFKWTCLTWQVCGVLTTRGSYDQGFLQSGVLQSGILTIRGSNQRVLHNRSVPRCW